MMEKVLKKQSIDIWPIRYQNYDPINAQLDNTGKSLVALQPTSPLHSVLYPIPEAKSSTLFNLLIRFRQNK